MTLFSSCGCNLSHFLRQAQRRLDNQRDDHGHEEQTPNFLNQCGKVAGFVIDARKIEVVDRQRFQLPHGSGHGFAAVAHCIEELAEFRLVHGGTVAEKSKERQPPGAMGTILITPAALLS